MAINVERLLQHHMDRWVYLLGLGRWRITWDLVDDLDGGASVARNDHFVRRSGYRTAHVRFNRSEVTTAVKIERAVIHELIHLFQHGVGNDAEKLVERLERPLRRVRQRLSKR
jgi:hypothetical protein